MRRQAIELAQADKMHKIQKLSAGLCFNKPNKFLIQIEKEMTYSVGCDVYIRQQNAIITRQNYEERISSLTCETLILAGKNDKIIPYSDQIEMFKKISRSSLNILNDCGHLQTLEKSKHALLSIKVFLNSKH